MGLARRVVLGGGVLGTTAMVAAACTKAKPAPAAAAVPPAVKPVLDGDLVYFNRAGAVDPAVLAGFAKEYGVKVIPSTFDSMDSMVAKLDTGAAYDIIFPTAKVTQTLWQAGKLHRIDRNSMLNAGSIFNSYAFFTDPWYDPQSQHSVPFTIYKTGIGWRTDKIGSLTKSWGDMWNAKAKGHAYALDDRDEVLGMGALRLGLDVNTAAAPDLKNIVALLTNLRAHLRAFDQHDTTNLLTGAAWLTQASSGDVAAAVRKSTGPHRFGFEALHEGSPVNSSCYAIPANAAHPGTALLFIDYLLRPKNVLANMKHSGFQMPVRGTGSAYKSMVKHIPEALVTAADLANGLVFRNGTAAQERARTAAWAEVQAV